MKKFLSMAALALAGAIMTGCSKENDAVQQPTQPTQKGNIVTLTTTVSLDGGAGTRALTLGGVKTFAEGEKMAVVYNNGTSLVKAESHALADGDITNGGKNATFTFDLETPDKTKNVTYIYPAAMAKDDGSVNYDALASQDGTLDNLGKNFDYCTKSGAWSAGNLPTLTLENQLAILAITIKDAGGSNNLTSTISQLALSDGTNSYTVNRSLAAGPIYVAIRPTASADITVTATDGTNNYTKTLADKKTYAAGNIYNLGWRMSLLVDLSKVDEQQFTVPNGATLTGTLENYVKISIPENGTVILDNATINGINYYNSYTHAGLNCLGNANIILHGTNTIKGYHHHYPGIHVPSGSTLTIDGDGSLTASSNGYGAGIGGGYNIDCGNIIINGGNITATGGDYAAGIGGGYQGSCGTITIGGTMTYVTATMGSSATHSIGAGKSGSCGTVTVGGVVYPDGITTSPYTFNSNDLSKVTTNTTVPDGATLTGELGANVKITIADGATVTLYNVTINGVNNNSYQWAGINCEGNATIILSGTNTVRGFHRYYPGIHVPSGKTLTIRGTGTLMARNTGTGAGIGGGYHIDCGNIRIEGGTITATGNDYAAGIGSGDNATCGDITITGGTVEATGGYKAAGIGSGDQGSCGNILIEGGTINATGGYDSAGIGCGSSGTCGDITITNGVTSVTAKKGTDAPNSIGRGFGSSSSCGTVTIGGVVTGNISTSPYTYEPAH